MAKICKNCGNQLKPTSKFCSKCGTPYVDEPGSQEKDASDARVQPQSAVPPVQPQGTSTPSQKESGSGSKGFWYNYFKWGIIISIILFAFTVFCGNDTDEKKAVDNNGKVATTVEVMDNIFLGKWSRLKPGSQNTKTPSTITIKKANSQTGGYEVEVFFYRIADAKGYANIDGNKLSINQGIINDRFNFRGTIEKTNNGIRLTVTESGFQHVKPGSVYEYIK